MHITDIVNRDLVNLTNCEHEPIHIPGSIQPHGFLIAVDILKNTISFSSGNTAEFIGISYEEILNKPIAEILGEQQLSLVNEYLSKQQKHARLPLTLQFNGKSFYCTVHQSANNIIIEGEAISEPPIASGSLYEQTSQFLSYMEETHTMQQLCQLVADGTRQITGYDRVMIYRFDKDYNGEVFAESRINTIEPFLGLYYPHTDIPVQARELYLKNLLRLIAAIDYTPVPIYTINEPSEQNLDLSLSILRSTSPIHIQYLQNMGVGATLTISLIHQGKLWGLIACHHYSAKTISPEIRLAAQLQGHFITSQIDVRQSNEEYDIARKTNLALEKLSSLELAPERNSLQGIVNSGEILSLCNASAVVIILDGTIYKSADCASDELIRRLVTTFDEAENPVVTDNLRIHLSDSEFDCEKVSGILLHRLAKNCLILWLRPESLSEINWAGDPSKAILKDEKGLSPRNSFALYKQTVKCQSKPWLQPELNSAANYAHLLHTHINLILLGEEEKRNRELNVILTDTNSELENINWISTHDLQEPLRKIQLNASRILGSNFTVPEKIENAIRRMDSSAKRMQTLLLDIVDYMNLRHTEKTLEPVDLKSVIDEIVAEFHEQIKDKNATIEVGNLPVVYGMPVLVNQLFSHLIGNALKNTKPNVQPIIQIAAAEKWKATDISNADESYYPITVADNGTGFEAKFEESVFNIFTRLNSDPENKGSGVGLALCKKIMIAHDGFISAKGGVNVGARFTCYFPVINTASQAVSASS